jgi:hypothetical protein
MNEESGGVAESQSGETAWILWLIFAGALGWWALTCVSVGGAVFHVLLGADAEVDGFARLVLGVKVL